jgi:DNA polymerase-3 subunit delta'
MKNTWDGLYGQQNVKTMLEYFINSDKIPHGLLFAGQEGVGKDFTAVKLAQLLNHNTANYQTVSKLISSFSEPYIKYIVPLPRGKSEDDDSGPYDKLSADDIQLIRDAFGEKGKNPYYKVAIPKANAIKISSIRDIKKFVMLEYSDIKSRIVLISQAHLMNEEAQNALLKNLEEPPEGIVFILTTPYPEQLRETILSRCWLVKFNPLTETDITEILITHFQVERELAFKVAPFAGGSVSVALQFIEAGFDELLENVILLLRYSYGRKYNSAFSVVDKYLRMTDKEPLKLLLSMILNWMNDLERFRNNSEIVFFQNHRDTFIKFNNKFPNIRITDTVTSIEKLVYSIRSNINPGAILLRLIYELASLVTPLKVKA